MSESDTKHALLPPRSAAEWAAYHAIRRDAIFAVHLPEQAYDENDPDEFKPCSAINNGGGSLSAGATDPTGGSGGTQYVRTIPSTSNEWRSKYFGGTNRSLP